MNDEKKDSGGPRRVVFSFRESPSFRSIDLAGAFGSLTPKGKIYLALYSERNHTPEQSTLLVSENGQVISTEEMKHTPGVLRDVEIGMTMDLDTAVSLRDWLSVQIQDLQKALEDRKQKIKKNA